MNWHRHPPTVDALAGEYVLGTLRGGARRRFETVMAQQPAVRAAVASWEVQLGRLAQAVPPVAPRPQLWERIASQAGLASSAHSPAATPAVADPSGGPALPPSATDPARAPTPGAATPAPAAPPRPPVRAAPAPSGGSRWLQGLRQWLTPVPAGALAFGLLLGLVIPQVHQALQPPAAADSELPESYVGVLALPDGRGGLIVASRRHGRVADLKQLVPLTPPAGQTLYLWAIDAAGQARPVGPVPHGPFVQATLPDTAERVFQQAAELGVTFEPAGSQPAQPGGPWQVRGLCGKVWRTPAPPAGGAGASAPGR